MASTPLVTPYLTTDGLIASVMRRISFPANQSTFQESDIIAFLNEEMFISQVPSVLQFHQEFFVYSIDVPLVSNKTRYPIPNRAIGMKLRDIFYLDTNYNLYPMTRVNPEDKAWWQRDFDTGRQPYPYYLENNDIVLTATNIPNPAGYFRISFFIRPNQLVDDSNAATITNFSNTLTVDNTSAAVGDQLLVINSLPFNPYTIGQPGPNQVIVTLTAVTGTPGVNQYNIGLTSADTATNIAAALNMYAPILVTAVANGNVVTTSFFDSITSLQTNNIPAYTIPAELTLTFDQIPSNITNSSIIDFLQRLPGSKIQKFDIPIGSAAISGLNITFPQYVVPTSTIIGDYICLANTAIIPYLPPDMHTLLAERASARILAAIGDLENLQQSQARINEMEKGQGVLINNRVEGSPVKVSNKNTQLRFGKRLSIRRF